MNSNGPFIERCPHDRENPYAQTSRALIRDNRLHPSACWMLVYLLSMKDGWKISPRQLVDHCKGHFGCGRDKVYDWINQAIDLGYMKKEVWLEGGLTRCRYLLSESPRFKKCLRDPDHQDPDSRDPVNTDYKKEHIKDKKHIKEESTLAGAKESAASSKPSARIARAAHVSTSLEEHEKLVKDFGEEMIQKAYERLSEWKTDTPKSKWKKNDHLAIRRWVIDALKEADKKAEKASQSPVNRIKEVQRYLSTHRQKKSIVEAKKAKKIDWGKDWIDFKCGPDSYILFNKPNSIMLIKHYLNKMRIYE